MTERRLLVLVVEFKNEEEKEIIAGMYEHEFIRDEMRNKIIFCESKGAMVLVVPDMFDYIKVVVSELKKVLSHAKLFLMKEYEGDNLDMWWNLCIRELKLFETENNSEEKNFIEEKCTEEIQTKYTEKPLEEKDFTEDHAKGDPLVEGDSMVEESSVYIVTTEENSEETLIEKTKELDDSEGMINAETFLRKVIHPGMTADDTVNKVLEELSLTQLFIPLFKRAIKVDKVTWEHLGLTSPYKRKKFIKEFSMRIEEKGIEPIRLPYFMAKLKEVYDSLSYGIHEESSQRKQEKGKLDSVIESLKAKGKEITVENLLNEIGLEKLSMEKQDAIRTCIEKFKNSTDDADTFVENMNLEERLILASMLDDTFPEEIEVQELLQELKKFG